MPHYADRVKETTTSTGTTAIVLSGVAATRCVTFATAFGAGSRIVSYCIEGQAASGEWEVGKGVFNGTTGLTRDTIRSSSNANALVNFSAGTKDVFVTVSAEHADNSNLGNIYGMARGFMLP